jgi:hypothetical protein
MINYEVRKQLPTDTLVLDNHAYDNSIIGLTFDGRAIYEFELMCEEFSDDEQCSIEDAIDWVEYNTLRALPYLGEKHPIVVSVVM